MNSVYLDGSIGRVERKEYGVFIRLCYKESFYSKKEGEWIKSEDWVSIGFFGKTADAVERQVQVGDNLIVEAAIAVWPKDGVESRIRLNGKSFSVLLPHSMRAAPGGNNDEE